MVRRLAVAICAILAIGGAAQGAAQRASHDRMIGSPGRDPFVYKDSRMLIFIPRNDSAPQIAVGVKCFDDGYSILTVGMPGYEGFLKNKEGYDVSFKVNDGAIITVHMGDTPNNSGVSVDSNDEPRVRELLGRFLDADKIAVAFRGQAYLLTISPPGRDEKKMMDFCGPKD